MSMTTISASDIARVRRGIEIRAAALHQTGDERSLSEAKKLRYALQVADTAGVTLGVALQSAGLDARATLTTILNLMPRT